MFFDGLSPIDARPRASDQTSALIHELSHTPALGYPTTQDFHAQHDIELLVPEQIIHSAYAFEYYAKSLYLRYRI